VKLGLRRTRTLGGRGGVDVILLGLRLRVRAFVAARSREGGGTYVWLGEVYIQFERSSLRTISMASKATVTSKPGDSRILIDIKIKSR
jgi:hypothetical protein